MDKIALMLSKARTNAKLSQDTMAEAMGVSRKTIQKWEDGTLCPNMKKVIQWFDVTGEPLYPYMVTLLHEGSFEGLGPNKDTEVIKDAIYTYIDEMSDRRVRELTYLMYSDHGSTPSGVLDLITAYLHLPLDRRVCIASAVLHAYIICESTNQLRGTDHILPNIKFLKHCCDSATEAVMKGKGSYMNMEVNDETKKIE